MSLVNAYVTLAQYKAHITAPGQTLTTDTTDDAEIERILQAASRYVDGQTERTFYPRVETRSYSVPDEDETNDERLLLLDDDLLALTTLTNGDDTTIAATEYNLLSKNTSPKWGIRLKDTSDTIWEVDSDSNAEYVIDVLGWWGYHNQYSQRAWSNGGTLGAAISDTTTLAFTMSAGHSIAAGQVLKIDSEIFIVNTVVTNTVTPLARGDNGSTAATHSNGATVYVWNPMPEIVQATLEIAVNAYHRRFGQNLSGASKVTPAGVVISPADVSETAGRVLRRLQRVF